MTAPISTYSPSHSRSVYIFDFDGTLTEHDTTEFIGTLTAKGQAEWPGIVEKYMADLARFQDTPFPWSKFDAAEYSRWLNSRRMIEVASAKRAEDLGIFSGLQYAEMCQAVMKGFREGRLSFRSGWLELLQCAARRMQDGDEFAIVSVSWSETFIRQCLREAITVWSASASELASFVETIQIYANEVQSLRSPTGSSGATIRSPDTDIRVSGDKLNKLRHIRETADARQRSYTQLVYVGDSSTDFESLCYADLGIWICDVPCKELDRQTSKTFFPLKISTPPSLVTTLLRGVQEYKLADLPDAPYFYWSSGLLPVIDYMSRKGSNAS